MWIGSFILGGCNDTETNRYTYHVSQRARTFGADQRLTATVYPGRIREECSSEEPADICIWASGPFPGWRIANGRNQPTSTTVHIDNIGDTPHFNVVQTALFDHEEQAQTCRDQNPQSPIKLANEEGDTITFTIPPCRAIVFQEKLPENQSQYRIGLSGDLKLSQPDNTSFFSSLGALTPPIDFLLILGTPDFADTDNDYRALWEKAQSSPVPIGVSMTERIAKDKPEVYIDYFGSMDYVSTIGSSRLLVLDTASRTVSTEQISFLSNIKRPNCNGACPPGVLATFLSPLGPSTALRRSWTSEFIAQSIMTRLAERGFYHIFDIAFRYDDSQNLGNISAQHIRDVQTNEDLAILHFQALQQPLPTCSNAFDSMISSPLYPTPVHDTCRADEICLGGFCHPICNLRTNCEMPGFSCFRNSHCRATCDSATPCPQGARCVDGWCEHKAFIELER